MIWKLALAAMAVAAVYAFLSRANRNNDDDDGDDDGDDRGGGPRRDPAEPDAPVAQPIPVRVDERMR